MLTTIHLILFFWLLQVEHDVIYRLGRRYDFSPLTLLFSINFLVDLRQARLVFLFILFDRAALLTDVLLLLNNLSFDQGRLLLLKLLLP